MKQLRKRMLLYFTVVYSILAVILLFSFVRLTQSQFLRQQEDIVADQLDVITDKLNSNDIEINDTASLQAEIEEISEYLHERVTLIDEDGEILYDTSVDIESTDNHADREEFIESIDSSEIATANRDSVSTGELMFYAAEPIYDDQGNLLAVLRISNSFSNFNTIILYLGGLIGLSILVLVIISFYMTIYWTNRIKNPIDDIRNVMNKLADKNYKARYTMDSYEEINELGETINFLADNLESQMHEIRQNDRRLTTLLENLVVGVILLNEDREITVCNPVVNEILGINLYGQLGRDYTDIIQSAEITKLVEKAIRKKKAQNKEVVLYLQNERIVDINVVPIASGDGEYNYVVLLYDITEIKRLERVRTDFVANASHELRTPITALKGFSETLLDGAMDDRELLKEFLEIMLKESTRLDTMVHDILQLSRLEQRPNQYITDKVNVEEIAKDVMQILQQKAESKHIELTLDVNTDLFLTVNQDELKQVFINLIGNAITYTPEDGHVTIRLDKGPYEGIIEIIDDGIGIPVKERDRIFERFYRVDKARSRNAGGTGLGLSIVKWLVDGMDGRIELDSHLAEGSTFRVFIPLEKND